MWRKPVPKLVYFLAKFGPFCLTAYKPQEAAWSIFAEKPQEKDDTPLAEVRTAEPALEFTFGASTPEPASADIFKPVPLPAPAAKAPKSAVRKRKADEISEDQFLLFKIA